MSSSSSAQQSPADLIITPSDSSSDGERSPTLWGSHSPRYYDITPPIEIVHIEDVEEYNSGPIHDGMEPVVAIIGCGYVGEHLLNVFSKRYDVLGFDISAFRAEQLSKKYLENDRIRITSSTSDLKGATHFLIAVPTLLRPDKSVDSSFLRSALSTVRIHARQGATVVIESSVAVGMTRELLGPIAKGKNFFAGMSPERVDPGRISPAPEEIPKVVSGLDDIVPGSLQAIQKIYSVVFQNVIPVSRPEVAEMMKLYENCQRMVCIAYANEMADACIQHGINPFEVSAAAATKPFGFIPMMPGPGVGGHCIPVNPYYLLSNNEFPLLEAAAEKMRVRPAEIASRAIDRLYGQPTNARNGSHVSSGPEGSNGLRGSNGLNGSSGPHNVNGLNGGNGSKECNGSQDSTNETGNGAISLPRVLVVGIGFKAGQSHLVNSPGLDMAQNLAISGKVKVSWLDPLVEQAAVPNISRLDKADWNAEQLQQDFDMIIVAMKQHGLDWRILDEVKGVHVEMWCS